MTDTDRELAYTGTVALGCLLCTTQAVASLARWLKLGEDVGLAYGALMTIGAAWCWTEIFDAYDRYRRLARQKEDANDGDRK